jgi:ferric-dicitrate binding protein FerR (iron transport regulator)
MTLIMEEAARWYFHFEGGEVPPAVRASYLCWLKASPLHIAEMLRMRMFISRLHRAGPLIAIPNPPQDR